MPYSRETAGKGGHSDLVRNQDVADFLGDCEYMKEPSDEEASEIVSTFTEAPTGGHRPEMVAASDASPYAAPISGKFPSTQVGYVKVSLVLIDLNKFDGLSAPGSRFVDPFKVAELHRNADSFAFTLPGSNIRYKHSSSVKNGFRRAVFDQLSDARTNLFPKGKFSVKDTLLFIYDNQITLKACPSCGNEPQDGFVFTDSNVSHDCQQCNEQVFVTDSLRIHEQISDYGDNVSAMTRFMNVTEHLIMASFIRGLYERQPSALSNMAFIVDGPLAIFGQPAKVHARLMSFYAGMTMDLESRGLTPPIIIGLQKDGVVMEHARSLLRFLNQDGVGKGKALYRVVDDAYRNRYISEVTSDNFGNETYYGQDFILKTESGRIFTVALPYPFRNKEPAREFAVKKAIDTNYGNQLARAFDLIKYFEFDLYDNAVIPVALAHRHASISLIPGGKVLELVTRNGLGGQ
jgi:hypothetical protein